MLTLSKQKEKRSEYFRWGRHFYSQFWLIRHDANVPIETFGGVPKVPRKSAET